MHRWFLAILCFAGAALAALNALSPWDLPRPEPAYHGFQSAIVAIVFAALGIYQLLKKRPKA